MIGAWIHERRKLLQLPLRELAERLAAAETSVGDPPLTDAQMVDQWFDRLAAVELGDGQLSAEQLARVLSALHAMRLADQVLALALPPDERCERAPNEPARELPRRYAQVAPASWGLVELNDLAHDLTGLSEGMLEFLLGYVGALRERPVPSVGVLQPKTSTSVEVSPASPPPESRGFAFAEVLGRRVRLRADSRIRVRHVLPLGTDCDSRVEELTSAELEQALQVLERDWDGFGTLARVGVVVTERDVWICWQFRPGWTAIGTVTSSDTIQVTPDLKRVTVAARPLRYPLWPTGVWWAFGLDAWRPVEVRVLSPAGVSERHELLHASLIERRMQPSQFALGFLPAGVWVEVDLERVDTNPTKSTHELSLAIVGRRVAMETELRAEQLGEGE